MSTHKDGVPHLLFDRIPNVGLWATSWQTLAKNQGRKAHKHRQLWRFPLELFFEINPGILCTVEFKNDYVLGFIIARYLLQLLYRIGSVGEYVP